MMGRTLEQLKDPLSVAAPVLRKNSIGRPLSWWTSKILKILAVLETRSRNERMPQRTPEMPTYLLLVFNGHSPTDEHGIIHSAFFSLTQTCRAMEVRGAIGAVQAPHRRQYPPFG